MGTGGDMTIKFDIKITDEEVPAIDPSNDSCTIRTNNDSTITLDRKTLERMIACLDADKEVSNRINDFIKNAQIS